MTKSKSMKLAALLLALTLITSCFVGGTFAKYIVDGTASDSAAVAYWGLNEATTAVTFELFNVSDDTGIAADGKIAPGSEKEVEFEFINANTGNKAPEVAYKVTVALTEDTTESIGALDNELTWTLNGTTYNSWSALKAGILALSGDPSGTKEYKANDPLPEILQSDVTNKIKWKWEFSNGGDPEDTALGNAATQQPIELGITVTVQQLDVYPTP